MKVTMKYEFHELLDKDRNVMMNIPRRYFNYQHTHGYKQILIGFINAKVWCTGAQHAGYKQLNHSM